MVQDLVARIVIVESYGNNARSLSSHLQGLAIPIKILTVIDGETAIAQLQKETADLLIVDTCLRGRMSGFDFCRTLRSSDSNQNIPIILLLAGYLSLERSKGILAGADLLLHRPIVAEELLRMIQLLLGERFNQTGNSRSAVPENPPVRILRPVS